MTYTTLVEPGELAPRLGEDHVLSLDVLSDHCEQGVRACASFPTLPP